MSILIDVVKFATAKPTNKVAPQVKQSRLSICEVCPFMHTASLAGVTVRSCGKYLGGGTVEHKGGVYELCGCDVDDKTSYKYDACPLGKWGNDNS